MRTLHAWLRSSYSVDRSASVGKMTTHAVDHKDSNIGDHIEHASIDLEQKGALHATINGHEIDEETAKYLDPTVVIDDATNKRIKSMVSSECWCE